MIHRDTLREFLCANMFDGSDEGRTTWDKADLLDEIADLITEHVRDKAEDDHERRCTFIPNVAPFERCPDRPSHLERATLEAWSDRA